MTTLFYKKKKSFKCLPAHCDNEYEETFFFINFHLSILSNEAKAAFLFQLAVNVEIRGVDLLIAGHGQRLGGGGHKRSL